MQRQFFPTEEDEMGAAKALMRLQDTYKLDPDTISKGQLPGTLPLQALLIQWMCVYYGVWTLLWIGATTIWWSSPSGTPSLLVMILSWVSRWYQSPPFP